MKNKYMKTYITSDLHFSHKRILDFTPKRKEVLNCETVQEMNEALIKHWNETVKPEDTIYHLGDFMFPNKDTKLKDIIPRLNGKKIFILGNHDNKKWFESLNDPTLEVHQYLEIKYKIFNKVNMLKTNSGDSIKGLSNDYKKGDVVPLVANETGKVFECIEKDIILFHFPIHAWNKMEQGSLHFFGHCHGSHNPEGNKSIDVGFCAQLKILTMEEAIELADAKPIYKRSYHQ